MNIVVLPQAADEFEDAATGYETSANRALHRTAAREPLLGIQKALAGRRR